MAEPSPPQPLRRASLPPDNWSDLNAYSRFLERELLHSIRIEFWESLRTGSRETVSLGPLGLVAASPGLRTLLRRHLRSGAWAREGPYRLFLAVAWVELWQQLRLRGWWKFRVQLRPWAETRAEQLLAAWLKLQGPRRLRWGVKGGTGEGTGDTQPHPGDDPGEK